MRDLLTAIAIVVIVALTAALVGPYLVDWNGQRAFLEARLSRALGEKVTIGGQIDLKLLPNPYLDLGQTVIGSDEGQVRVGIRHLNLELSITPLLHGEFEITEARLRQPTLRLSLQPGRSLPMPGNAPAFDAKLRFDRIVVDDGTIAVSDVESGKTAVFDHLDMVADAASPSGPFKAQGTAGGPDVRTRFRFSTGTVQKGGTQTHFVVDETSRHLGLDLDGSLGFASTSEGRLAPHFDGTTLASGGQTESDDGLKWSIKGPVKIDAHNASLDGGALRIGTEDAGLSLDIDGKFNLAEQQDLALTIRANRLDIDRLAGTDPVKKDPPHLPSITDIRAAFAGLPTTVSVKVDAATYGGEALNDLALRMSLNEPQGETFALESHGPGRSNLTLDAMSADGSKDIRGSFAFGTDDATETMNWLSTVNPTFKPTTLMPFSSIQAKGDFVSTPKEVISKNLTLMLDNSHLVGMSGLTYGVNGAPGRLVAEMKADALDVDTLPSVDAMSTSFGSLDLKLALDARTVNISHVGDSDLKAGNLKFGLTRVGDRVELQNLRADDIGGATIVGQGFADKNSANMSMTLEAKKLDDAANVLVRLFPGEITQFVKHRAPSLVPASIKVAAAFSRKQDGRFEPAKLMINGRLASTDINADIKPSADNVETFDMSVSAKSPQGHLLLSQLGFPTLPLDLLGASHVSFTARGSRGEAAQTHLQGTFGATELSLDGRLNLFGSSKGGSGTVDLKSKDVSPLLQSLALAFPDLSGRLPIAFTGGFAVGETGLAFSDLKGTLSDTPVAGTLKWDMQPGQPTLTGALDLDTITAARLFALSLGPQQPSTNDNGFSRSPFTTGLIDPPQSALKLRAKTLYLGEGVVATDASVDLDVSTNTIEFKKIQAKVAQGRLSGNALLRRNGTQAAVEGNLVADGVELSSPAVRGRLNGHLDFAGSGQSAAALVSSLAGSGQATIKGLTIDRSDQAALSHVFNAIERDEVAVDEPSVIRAYDAASQTPNVMGDREFRLGLASGILRLDQIDDGDKPKSANSEIDGTLDLNRSAVTTTTTETLHDLPQNWTGSPPSVSVTWAGPLQAPVRRVDASSLINAAASRALARETARLEAYEFDLRERSFFNNRLSTEHRREADQLKAADDAKKAEEAKAAAKKAAEERAAQDNADRTGEPSMPQVDPASRQFQSAPGGTAVDPSSAGRY